MKMVYQPRAILAMTGLAVAGAFILPLRTPVYPAQCARRATSSRMASTMAVSQDELKKQVRRPHGQRSTHLCLQHANCITIRLVVWLRRWGTRLWMTM